MPGTRTCTPIRCRSRAPCGSRRRSTSPTPWTWTPPCRSVPPGWPTSAPPPPWTCAAPRRSGRWRGTSSPWTSTPPATRRPRPPPRPRLRPGRWCCTCTSPTRRSPTPDARLHLARVANTRSFVDAEQVRGWCGLPGTTVTVKPVVDLAEHLHVDQYQVPDRLAQQATERDVTCVFPWCTRPAEKCDLDHVIPYAEGGPTASDNLGPLCRRHHRLKTHHSGWGYTVLEPGCYLWSSPHGYQFLRDHRGTTDVTRDRARTLPTSSDPAPHPAPAPKARGLRHVSGPVGRPAPPPPPSQRARESAAAGRYPATAAGGERKRWRGGDEVPNPSGRPPPTRHPPATAGGGRRVQSGASPRVPDA